MATTYEKHPESQAIVDQLIMQHHEHLEGAVVVCLIKDAGGDRPKPGKFGKKQKLASASLVPKKFGPLTSADFVILIEGPHWVFLTDEQRTALCDHELMHCRYDNETGDYYLADHDIEEFGAIVERYGLWKPDVKQFSDVLQRSLFEAV